MSSIVNGEKDRQALEKIAITRPTVGTAFDAVRRRADVKISEDRAGKMTITTDSLRAKQAIAETGRVARRLISERGEEVSRRVQRVTVRGKNGKRIQIGAENEQGMARAGMVGASVRYGGAKIVAGPDGELFRVCPDGSLEGTGKVYLGHEPYPWQAAKQAEMERIRKHRADVLDSMRVGT